MNTTATTTRKWSTRGAWGAEMTVGPRPTTETPARQYRAAAPSCHYCGGTVRRGECSDCGEAHETY